MGHLNELHEKFEAEGLTVLAVTTEDRAKVDAFVESTGATHPIVIESSDSGRAYGIGGYPASFLIDGTGSVVWSGHPAGVKDEQIQELLATLLPELPKSLSAISKAISKDKYAAAQKLVLKKQAVEDLPAEETEALELVANWLDSRRASAKKRVERAMGKDDFYSAWVTWDEVADAWKGDPFAKEADAAIKALLAEKGPKTEIKAGKKLAKIKAKLTELGAKKGIKQLEAFESKKYDGTLAQKEAAALVRRLKKEMAARR